VRYSDADIHANRDCYGHCHTNWHRAAYAHGYRYCYSHSHSDANSDGHVYADADPNTDVRYLYHYLD
jgi:hypothetical protein